MPGVKIRLLQTSGVASLSPYHARLIRRLDARCFPEDRRTGTRGTWWFIATIDGRAVGYMGVKETGGPGLWRIPRTGVLRRYRKQGIGRAMSEAAFKFMRGRGGRLVTTYIATNNTASINNRIAGGFRVRRNPVGWSDRWLWMEKAL